MKNTIPVCTIFPTKKCCKKKGIIPLDVLKRFQFVKKGGFYFKSRLTLYLNTLHVITQFIYLETFVRKLLWLGGSLWYLRSDIFCKFWSEGISEKFQNFAKLVLTNAKNWKTWRGQRKTKQ